MAVNHCYPALHTNFVVAGQGFNEEILKQAVEAGAKVARISIPSGGTAASFALACHNKGIKWCWLTAGKPPPATLADIISKYAAMGANEKGAILCIEYGNENWNEESGAGTAMTGHEYGTKFLEVCEEQRGEAFTVPLLMQVRFQPAPANHKKWMESLVGGEYKGKTKKEALKTALIGNGSESAPQNWLASHPYVTKMTTKQKEPTNLSSTSDAEGSYGSQRWMKEQYFILKEVGVLSPICLTEYGANAASEGANHVGSWGAVAEHVEAMFWRNPANHEEAGFLKKVKEGKVPSEDLPAASGYKPAVVFGAWYDMYGTTGTEQYGIIAFKEPNPPGAKNEEANFYKRWKESAEALTAAGGEEEAAKLSVSIAATSTVTAKTKTGVTQLIGNSGASFTVAELERNGREAAFQFTAEKSGNVAELQFRTSGIANTGVENVFLGIAEENAGKPGTVLSQGHFVGLPAINTWVKVTLESSVPVTQGAKYWLILLSTGEASEGKNHIHFNFAVASGGSLSYESTKTTFTKIETTSEWGAEKHQGPLGFYGIGGESTKLPLAVTIGAVSTVTASSQSRMQRVTIAATSTVQAFVSFRQPRGTFAQRLIERLEPWL